MTDTNYLYEYFLEKSNEDEKGSEEKSDDNELEENEDEKTAISASKKPVVEKQKIKTKKT